MVIFGFLEISSPQRGVCVREGGVGKSACCVERLANTMCRRHTSNRLLDIHEPPLLLGRRRFAAGTTRLTLNGAVLWGSEPGAWSGTRGVAPAELPILVWNRGMLWEGMEGGGKTLLLN